jgi:hypothetical protein
MLIDYIIMVIEGYMKVILLTTLSKFENSMRNWEFDRLWKMISIILSYLFWFLSHGKVIHSNIFNFSFRLIVITIN